MVDPPHANQRPRILVVNPYGQPGAYSGPSVFLKRLCQELSSHADIDLITSVEAGLSHPPWASTVRPVSRVGSFSPFSQLRFAAGAALAVVRWVPKPTILHLHGAYFFTLVPVIAARVRKIPVMILPLAEGGDLRFDARSARFPGVARLRKFLVSRATGGLALSAGVVSDLGNAGLCRDRVFRLNNIAADTFFDLDPDTQLRREGHTMLFIGKLGERKGSMVLAEVLSILRQRGYNARLHVVGPYENEAERAQFGARLRELNVEDACVVTQHVEDVAINIDPLANLFVLPSRQEGMPGALCEAMAGGYPCIVTDVGSMGEVVREAASGDVVQREADSIARAIERRWTDADLLTRESRNARAFAHRSFSARAVAGQYLSALSQVSIANKDKRVFSHE